MFVEHLKSLKCVENVSIESKIRCAAWSPKLNKLAVCLDKLNQIYLFDTINFERKEKFTAKSSSGLNEKNFSIQDLAFNQDATKLAVGQTDCVIYVYELGIEWSSKKSILGKYSFQSHVTCLNWTQAGIICGLSDGKIKLIQTSYNKITNLFSNDGLLVICISIFSNKLVAMFIDGLIVIINLSENNSIIQSKTNYPPYIMSFISNDHLAFNSNISTLSIINLKNIDSSSFDLNEEKLQKQTIELNNEINCISASPETKFIICACLETINILVFIDQLWIKSQTINLTGYGLICSLNFSFDGIHFISTSINGYLDFFQIKYKKKFVLSSYEINFVGANQISIKNLSKVNLKPILIKSKFNFKNIKILKNQFLVIWTKYSLIFSNLNQTQFNFDLNKKDFTEIIWDRVSDDLKFSFDYDDIVLINLFGELYIFQLNTGKLLTSVRTDFISSHLLSVRVEERESKNKIFAYLLDAKTIAIIDLNLDKQIKTINHDKNIDWLELNETGTKLILRDTSLNLYYYDLCYLILNDFKLNDSFKYLLNKCTFVQWIPLSDVIVGQSNDKLYIFFDLDKPTIYNVNTNSKVENIIREDGQTKIIIADEDIENEKNVITLNETFLEFDTALHDGNLKRAMLFLDEQEILSTTYSELSSTWLKLVKVANQKKDYLVLERALAASGNLIKSQFINQCSTNSTLKAILEKNWTELENINTFEQVIEIYIKLNKWTWAIDFSHKLNNFDKQNELEQSYYNYLLENYREFEAGKIDEKNDNLLNAINLYLKSNRVLDASRLILSVERNRKNFKFSQDLLLKVVNKLESNQYFEEAGYFYEQNLLTDDSVDNFELAFQCYKKGNLFNLAIQLAREKFPMQVVVLEEEFGDYLVRRNDFDKAILHYIEAGCNEKALNCAIKSLDFERASELALILGKSVKPEIIKKIINYYLKNNNLEICIKLYLNAGFYKEAIQLLNDRKHFKRAFSLIKETMSMSEEDAKEIFSQLGSTFEKEENYKDAEKVYLVCDQVDKAISMYKEIKNYEEMIRLVNEYHPNLLNQTHKHLAKELEYENNYKQAEFHYLCAGEWKNAIQMYRKVNKWEDAYKIANLFDTNLAHQIALYWAKSLDDTDEVNKILTKYGLLNQVIEDAIENRLFDLANNLGKFVGEKKLNEINLKWANHLEEEGKLFEAEKLYLKAGKPREAVLMYLHAKKFENAINLAEKEVKDELLIKEILTNEAKNILSKYEHKFKSKNERQSLRNNFEFKLDLNKMENLLIKASKPELIINIYKMYGFYDEAMTVCERYAQHLIPILKRERILNEQSVNKQQVKQNKQSNYSNNQETYVALSIEDILNQIQTAHQNNLKNEELKFAFILCMKYISLENHLEALKIINRFNGLILINESKKLIQRISIELFAMNNGYEPSLNEWKLLRDTLFNFHSNFDTFSAEKNREKNLNQQNQAQFTDYNQLIETYMLLAHYLYLRKALENLYKQNVEFAGELYLKLSIALLRYTNVLRVDKMFYETDLVDAIEEKDLNLDCSSFEDTDIPKEVPLPDQIFLYQQAQTKSPDLDVKFQIEQIKNWILEKSMQTNQIFKLPLNRNKIYEASLKQSKDKLSFACLVTAYPVLEEDIFELKPDKFAVNRNDWNCFLSIAKTTSNIEIKDSVYFIGRLCGSSIGKILI